MDSFTNETITEEKFIISICSFMIPYHLVSSSICFCFTTSLDNLIEAVILPFLTCATNDQQQSSQVSFYDDEMP